MSTIMETAQWAAGRLSLKVHPSWRELNLALFEGIQRMNVSPCRLRVQLSAATGRKRDKE